MLFVLFSIWLFASIALADGSRNPFQTAASISQGTAFAAQDGDASAVFYNPAGMTQVHDIHRQYRGF